MIISVWQKSALPFVSQITCSVKNVSPKKNLQKMECWQTLENPVTDIWKFEYSKKGTPDTCMETTLWDRAYFELEMSQVGVNGYLPSRKKSMKIQSSMRSRELSWQNFQITFWHFLLLFLLYINRKNCRISRKRNFVKNLFCIGLKNCLKTDQNRSKNSSK